MYGQFPKEDWVPVDWGGGPAYIMEERSLKSTHELKVSIIKMSEAGLDSDPQNVEEGKEENQSSHYLSADARPINYITAAPNQNPRR